MRRYVTAACIVLAWGLAWAQGLGDAARKEQERRGRNKDKGVEARSFSDADLSGVGGTASGTQPAVSGANDAARPEAEASAPSRGSSVDSTRAAGRRQLDSLYGRIAGQAGALVAQAREFVAAECDRGQGDECNARAAALERLACAVGQNLEAADDLGRRAWLSPGEVRELRDRHGLEDDIWYQISRLSNQYCRG